MGSSESNRPLDSHTAYWWIAGSDRLSPCAEELILDDTNVVLVSAVSIYELELKIKFKRDQINSRPQVLIETLRDNNVEELSVTHHHAEHAACFNWDHRDPWDRLLAAQAILEECVLVSVDRKFDQVVTDRRW